MATTVADESPISLLLTTLGLTREDLQRRSDEMRQFLTAENPMPARVDSRGRANSSSSAHAAPSPSGTRRLPLTPVKSEPTEVALPPRQFESMDVIIERQRQARRGKKQRKEKDRDFQQGSVSLGSPTPSSASGLSMAFLQGRDDEQIDVKGQLGTDFRASTEASRRVGRSPPPLTPQHSKYYREHTVSQSNPVVPKVESPGPTLASLAQQLLCDPSILHYPLPQPASLTALQALQASTSAAPVTPHIRRIQALNETSERSPLPPSSPFLTTPQSSPIRGIVNLVSSPGPMGPPPEEESYGKLPYKLPSGPYSPNKPDLSYAALLGRAILSSPEHRLTLQEIYDWITIVYPFFKRGETTWMNSIRHVLSTTACFRKVTRDRALGRTQWAIWDEDLECFKGGGFRKQFCKDMNGGKIGPEPTGRGKRGRKPVEDTDNSVERKPKRAKKDSKDSDKGHQRAIAPAIAFPATRPAPPLQSYQEVSAASSAVPPLPAESGFRQLSVQPSSSPSRATSQFDGDDGILPSSPTSYTIPSSSASTSSVPDLTPNCSSSSPPPSSSEIELDAPIKIVEAPLCLAPSATMAGLDTDDEDGAHNIFSTTKSTKLTPVRSWTYSPRLKDLSQLGGKLNFSVPDSMDQSDDDSDDDGMLLNAVKSKNKKSMLAEPFDKLPYSPTRRRTTTKGRKSKAAPPKARSSRSMRLSTPPPRSGLSTPPPNPGHQISPVHTPLSHRGLHMSPSASLVHYKSHLDPPPILQFDQSSSSAGLSGGTPSTPKRSSLNFPLLDDSPFRASFGMSPFRTPGSSGLFDPHDPRALLDEEFRRLGPGGLGELSPAGGLFGGKDRRLLYDSPGGLDSSPGKYKRWW
ncbi:hypothetical protein BT96DRAFT_1019149 [Gymnopus androsaceus JB14]|uniref:Fork-head domain-containing protein n=1 Tax=Gymnopus androsaceus JB14 TaxID=1447944 RepID=A0A6A4HPH5_9AGAR|nr:hypothetical protein BT96DRAFT_1019149 [Gymnopus androsaceus JB14]